MNMAAIDSIRAARELRATGRIRESFEVVQHPLTAAGHSLLLWQHQPFFWEDIKGGNCMLTRRCARDAAFIRALWQDDIFVRQFHRVTTNIPQDLVALGRILDSEYVSLISDLGSLHWTVRDGNGSPFGVLSLTNMSLQHKRAEVLLGVRADAPFGLAPSAMLLLFGFYFRTLKFHKLCTLTFDDNQHSFNGVLHLGFREEGRLREHFFDAATGTFVDMVQAGLLAADAFSANNQRLMRRLQLH